MKKAPAIFIGHGSPMNAIEKNSFNDKLMQVSSQIEHQEINAIICISAHYQTDGLQINKSLKPKTIYDFTGFPKQLYEIEYKAHGDPIFAEALAKKLKAFNPKTTTEWGFDHGAWNVLMHLFPKAEIPVIMFSLDYNLSFKQHFELGKILGELRRRGILILGSGNIVHSFNGISFDNLAPKNPNAVNFENYVKSELKNKHFNQLLDFDKSIIEAAKFSVNSAEHYLPFLYILGASEDEEVPQIFNDEIVCSTISMMSVGFGI